LPIEIARLHPNEFDLLESVDDGYKPSPEHSVAVVARNEHHIVGRVFLVSPCHVEGIFLERPWRNGTVMKRLVHAIELEARAEGITKIFCFAKDDQMADYIERLGYKPSLLTVYEKVL
jgi:N-acetylglutamate synthase-like GNAT family acetyltransferase